jgi:hypothetical protein
MATRDPAAAAVQVCQAAEQLAEAMEAAAGTGLSQEAVAELKHIHGLADKINGAVQQLQTTTSSSAQQVKDAVVDLQPDLSNIKEVKAAVEILESTLKQQGRLQALRWALANVTLVENVYYSGESFQSFAKRLLLAAMKNNGQYLPGPTVESYMQQRYSREEAVRQISYKEQENKEARTKIVANIHTLTGIAPRLVDQGDKGWAIYID